MNPTFIIDPAASGSNYSILYLAAFLVGFVLLIREGHRRKFPVVPWMMVIATGFLFFIAGCRMIAYSGAEWAYIIRFERIPYETSRSVLGGVLFSICGILMARKCLGFRQEMMDAFAFVLPVGLIVQRFGCLMAGCCYGTTADLPWSVSYAPGAPAFADQVHSGILAQGAAFSIPVHPVQVYEVAAAVAIIITLLVVRNRLRAPGNLYLASLALYATFRFVFEFVRAPHGKVIGGGEVLGLTYVQWAILLFIPLLAGIIRWKETRRPSERREDQVVSMSRASLYFLFVGILFLVWSRWFNLVEILSLNVVLVPMLAVIAWKSFVAATLPKLRTATMALLLTTAFLMSQTYPVRPKEETNRQSYTSLSTGFLSGQTNLQDHRTWQAPIPGTSVPNGCGGTSSAYQTTSHNVSSDNDYFVGAVGINHISPEGKNGAFSFGGTFFAGNLKEHFDGVMTVQNAAGSSTKEAHDVTNYSLAGVKPFVQYDGMYWGLGGGVIVGSMRRLRHPSGETSASESYEFLPALSARVGTLSSLFVDYNLNNQAVPAFPVMNHEFGLGFGIGKQGGLVRIGTGSYVELFVAPLIPVGKNFLIEPRYAIGDVPLYSSGKTSVWSINVQYRFNRKIVEGF